MRAKMLLFLPFAAILSITDINSSRADVKNIASATDVSCKESLPKAVENVIRTAFPGEKVLYALQAYNDLRCEEPEDMANVLITIVKSTKEQLYGMFHLHFNRDGSLPNFMREIVTDTKEWKPARGSNWRKEWCMWMHYVYPEDKKKFKCGQFSFN